VTVGTRGLAAILCALLGATIARATDITEQAFEAASGYTTTATTGCAAQPVLGTNEDLVEIQCGTTGGPIVFPYVLGQDAGTAPSMQYYVTYTIDGVCAGGTNNNGRCKTNADCPSGSCASQGSVRCAAQLKMACYPDGADLNADVTPAQAYTQPLDTNPGPGKVWTQGGQQISTVPYNALTGAACGGECRDAVCQVNFSFVSISNQASYCNLRQVRLQYPRF